MAIWIRIVDPQWFDFVSARPAMAEVNLWTPGRRLLDGAEPGDLVLFRVRGRRGIAGSGLFFNAAIFGGLFKVRNGLLLRRDFHPLFEQGYMTVSPDHRVLFSTWLPRAYPRCETYLAFNRRQLRLPERRDLWPDPDLLAQHRATVFFKGGTIDG